MGAWGLHFDECDGALDFLGDVGDSRNWSDVERQISSFIADGGYENGEETLAALELVAAGLGRPNARLDPQLSAWAAGHSGEAQAIRNEAIDAARMIATQSELSELWEEAEEGADWQATVAELKTRLEA